MPIEALDAAFVRKAVCPEGKSKVDYYDSAITGFILEVRASGGKTFHLRYRDQHGKQRQHKIGDSRSISFDKARQAAQQLRSRVVLGDSPAEEKRIKRTVPTLNEFFEDRYIPFVKGYKKSWDSDESYYRNHLLKRFGGLHLDQITQQEVIEHHHALRATGYAAATCNRVHPPPLSIALCLPLLPPPISRIPMQHKTLCKVRAVFSSRLHDLLFI